MDTAHAYRKIGLLPVWVSEEGRLSAKRQIVESYRRQDLDLDAPPVSADGRVTLTHFSSRPDIERIDRTYYGISPGIPSGYRKESGLGPETYTASVDARLLYDLQAYPENLAETPDLNESERAIRDVGYSSYGLAQPGMGLVTAVFISFEIEASRIGKVERGPEVAIKDADNEHGRHEQTLRTSDTDSVEKQRERWDGQENHDFPSSQFLLK